MKTAPQIRISNIATIAPRCLLGLMLLWAQPRIAHAQYGVEPAPEPVGAASKPTGVDGLGVARQPDPPAKDPRANDLFEATVRTLAPVRTPGSGDSATAEPLAEVYGLGEAPAAEVAQPSRKVPESLRENMPASFAGNAMPGSVGGNAADVKIAGDLSAQFNLIESRPGVINSGNSSIWTMAGLFGAMALAAWYAFQITKNERTGPPRQRHRRPN